MNTHYSKWNRGVPTGVQKQSTCSVCSDSAQVIKQWWTVPKCHTWFVTFIFLGGKKKCTIHQNKNKPPKQPNKQSLKKKKIKKR